MQIFSDAVSTRRREMAHTAMLVVGDSAAMFAAFELGRLARSQADRPFAHVITPLHFAMLMLATVPVWIFIFAMSGLYRVQTHGGRVGEAGRVIAAVFSGVTLLTSVAYLSYSQAIFPSRAVPLFALLFGIPLVVIERQLVRGIMRSLFTSGRAQHNVVLVGGGDLANRIAVELAEPASGYRLLAHVREDYLGDFASDGLPVYDSLESAVAGMPTERVHEVIQADLQTSRSDAVRMMSFANENKMNYRFVPDKYGVYAAASKLTAIDGIPVMDVRLTSLDGWGAVGKRLFDAIGAAFLLVAFAPVMLAVAVASKITEPSAPVFYSQTRLGLGGQLIKVLKFRSMSWKYSTGPDREFKTAEEAFEAMGRADLIPEFQINQKVADDPRVSSLGGFLRKTSLDELPQLLNALTGRLSLVGPRPITVGELGRYGAQATSFVALKPGITGLWQVYGRSNTTYEQRIKLDIYYVENWTMGMDVSILARTLVSVAGRKGAV